MKTIDLTKIFKKYAGQWIALADNEKTVLASSKSAKEALLKAENKGYKEPILFKVPKKSLAYVGTTWK